MPRPNLSHERRDELTPTLARTFAELGYRRATTAELAKRCHVRENILYRLWTDKKHMFIDAINYVFENSQRTWTKLLEQSPDQDNPARQLLQYESHHHGELGLYRIVFAGISELDDPDIRHALAQMYTRFQRFIEQHTRQHRTHRTQPSPQLTAWAIIGLGTVANIAHELNLLNTNDRRQLFLECGQLLLDGRKPET